VVNGGPHRYSGSQFALLTQHHKQHVVAPVLRDGLGAGLVVVDTFDTDTLGTFTRDIPRVDTQIATARRKAQLAIELCGVQLGLGSEGTFQPTGFGFGSWNAEVVLCVDADIGIEVVGRATSVGHHHHATVRSVADLVAFADRAAFPSHGLVVRPDDGDGPEPSKGLTSREELIDAFERAKMSSRDGLVFVESDLRAHMNPTRMRTIAAAAEDLVKRLATRCPRCETPGFGRERAITGLPCAMCAAPTRQPTAYEFQCVGCGYAEARSSVGADERADPAQCDVCNP
jgi:hypothetical protein